MTIENIRHSLAHLLAMAMLKKFPSAKLGIGPTIDNGFYYDFKLPRPISDADLGPIETTMRELIGQNLNFKGQKVTPAKARSIFKNQPLKLDLIKEFTKEKKQLTVYATYPTGTKIENWKLPARLDFAQAKSGGKIGNCFLDLCRGGHVKNTSEINPEAFKLTKIAGAYWRGDEKNPMLTRIYGAAFANKKELDDYQKLQEEISRRDHRILGEKLDLFTFSDLVGSGLPLWTPKGTILRDILDDFVWRLRKARGYERVDIPHLTKKNLYEKSGHWEKFQNEIFKSTSREGQLLAVKPMNCPHHIQLYARRCWSYRELPQRYASTTKVYRDEQSGELSGLTRVRAITQDDAHVFCRSNQIKDEILKIWDIIREFYGRAGFDLKVRLSLRDPKKTKNYLGTPARWREAENILRDIVRQRQVPAREAIGEAAFYGPKIDFLATDSLGREWQLATIQLDLNMPERFDLVCVNEEGKSERIAMIHAAIMGAIERYIAILIEHYAGAFPFWLSPVQIAVLPISDKVKSYGLEILRRLRQAGHRAELDDRNETIGRKIREAELQKIPYLVIIGEREMSSKTVSVRKRQKGDLGVMPWSKFLAMIEKEKLT